MHRHYMKRPSYPFVVVPCCADGDGMNILRFQAAADATPSGMVSVIGLDSGKVDEICAKACEMVGEEGAVKIANYLCPGNYAVSGSIAVRL